MFVALVFRDGKLLLKRQSRRVTLSLFLRHMKMTPPSPMSKASKKYLHIGRKDRHQRSEREYSSFCLLNLHGDGSSRPKQLNDE